MIFSDIVALAKAGYSPKQVKELLEMVETSPKVAETKVEEITKPKETKTEPEKKEETKEDPIQSLINILKEEN